MYFEAECLDFKFHQYILLGTSMTPFDFSSVVCVICILTRMIFLMVCRLVYTECSDGGLPTYIKEEKSDILFLKIRYNRKKTIYIPLKKI